MFDKCLLFNIREVDQKLTKMAEESFRVIDMHPTYGYIIALIGNYNVIKVKIIAERLNLSSSTITRMIDKLVTWGYVQKGSDNSKVAISLTEQGEVILIEVKKCWDEFHAKYQENLDQENINNLQKELKLFNEHIK